MEKGNLFANFSGRNILDDTGNVKKTIILGKLIEMITVVSPETVQQFDSLAYFQVTLTVRNLTTAVFIETIQGPTGSLLGYMFRKVDGTISEAILNPTGRAPVMNLIDRETDFTGGVRAFDLGLIAEPAHYEVIPYIRIIQADLPEALITSIDEHADQYHYGYLKIPFKQESGSLTCLASNNDSMSR